MNKLLARIIARPILPVAVLGLLVVGLLAVLSFPATILPKRSAPVGYPAALPVGQLVFSSTSRPPGEVLRLATQRAWPVLAQIPGVGLPPAANGHPAATRGDSATQVAGYALVNGKRAVCIPVVNWGGASPLGLVNALKAKLPEMQSRLPADVRLSYEFDQSGYVVSAVSELVGESLLGALCTGFVGLLCLRSWRSALIGALTVLVAMLVVLLLSLVAGILTVVTSSGLGLVLGILVDEVTVLLEDMYQHLELGKPTAHAIADSYREVAPLEFLLLVCCLAVLASSCWLAGMLRPVFLPLSLAAGLALLLTGCLALALVPMLASWWLKKRDAYVPTTPEQLQETAATASRRFVQRRAQVLKHKRIPSISFVQLKRGYQAGLQRLMPHRGWVLGSYLLVVGGLAGLLYAHSGQDLLPPSNAPQFRVHLSSPSGSRVEADVQQVLASLDQLVDHQNVEISAAFVGQPPGGYGASSPYADNAGPGEATLQVALNEDLVLNMDAFKDRLRAAVHRQLPGVSLSFEPSTPAEKLLSQGARAAIEVQIGGRDPGASQVVATRLVAQLQALPYLRDVRLQRPLPAREVVAGEAAHRSSRPLLAVAANLSGQDLGTAARQVQQLLSRLRPPAGTTAVLSGPARLLAAMRGRLQAGLGVGLVLTLLALCVYVRSFRLALVVLVPLPAVLAGALGLLWLTSSTLSLPALGGIGMAMSVSVANAMLLATSCESLRRQSHNAPWAAVTAAGRRLRPVLMTAAILLGSLLPMAAGLGALGSQSAPLGRAAVGGLFGSACAVLLVLPLALAATLEKAPVGSIAQASDDAASPAYDAPEASLQKVA